MKALALLHAVQPVLVALSLVFLAVFVGCWIRYAVREARVLLPGRLLGADRRLRRCGEQPLVEFTAGPEEFGLIWHDRVLDEVVAEFERDLGWGGVR